MTESAADETSSDQIELSDSGVSAEANRIAELEAELEKARDLRVREAERADKANEQLWDQQAAIQELIEAQFNRMWSSSSDTSILPRPKWSQELAMIAHALDTYAIQVRHYGAGLTDIVDGTTVITNEDGDTERYLLDRELMRARAQAAIDKAAFDTGHL